MKITMRVVAALLLLILFMSAVSGCGEKGRALEAGQNACYAWEEKTGEKISRGKEESYEYTNGGGLSVSHKMMASMILSGNGMESDLDKYDSVVLVKLKTDTGEERVMVVADGENVFPESAGDK